LKVLEVIRCLDFKANTGPYVGVKFDPPAGTGIFTTIDDQCMQAINNRIVKWEDVVDTLVKDQAKSLVFKKNAKIRFKFSISHSAESVEYEMKEFIERNVDCISVFLDESMCLKTATQFSLIYQNKLTETEDISKGKTFKTIWGKFNVQMLDLMDELAEPLIKIKAPTETEVPAGKNAPAPSKVEQCELHFIRCIKPRPKPEFKDDQPGLFIHLLTLQQITYMGVLESVELK
jgi:myosin heavy subunit